MPLSPPTKLACLTLFAPPFRQQAQAADNATSLSVAKLAVATIDSGAASATPYTDVVVSSQGGLPLRAEWDETCVPSCHPLRYPDGLTENWKPPLYCLAVLRFSAPAPRKCVWFWAWRVSDRPAASWRKLFECRNRGFRIDGLAPPRSPRVAVCSIPTSTRRH